MREKRTKGILSFVLDRVEGEVTGCVNQFLKVVYGGLCTLASFFSVMVNQPAMTDDHVDLFRQF